MAESPHGRGAPNADDGANEAAPRKRAESDSLIPPGGLKPRRTVMGLAPAPHLGGASRAGSNESESRKARVAQRLAEIDAAQPRPTGPPAPAERVDSEPPFSTTWKGPPPPLPTPVTGQTGAPPTYESTPPGYASAPPRTGPPARTGPPPPAVTGPPPPVFGTTTMLMPERARLLSEAGRPSSGGRDVHPPAPDLAARTASNASDAVIEVEASPVTARMIPVAPPASAAAGMRKSEPPPVKATEVAPAATALALRPQEPSSVTKHERSSKLDPRLALLSEPHSSRAASFRLLRDSLIAKGMPRVLAISSAAPREGKTTCACNLALALAEMSATRVLLIDGNFFEPELGEVFTIDRLTPIVPPDGGAWLAPYKLVEITPALHVAAISRARGQSAPRFDQQRFEGMIERLVRVSYDYLIIDAPALRDSPVVLQMLTGADATVFAVRAGATTGRELRRAAEQLPPKKALGIALIDAVAP